ncbi:Uma2 family endonuclease [Roseofilum sp. BLCC_M154]|uniref:Uma2 family endonuclease n=1 Tax=Roseofilum acuticapitatum BLCC-M154 TaxID=3022444 RepID=A0ABT7AZU5_9CYAN|nr:Uma2 family endonuclease [Roseofilum acuticapitatum]MDJ1172438.1 Uma2 family endonuclease [Roseofilum acuticapitatum BLCC-M154]
MTLATNSPIKQRQLTFDEFLACYGSDKRYELIDGEVFDLEPTGQHEEVAAFITTKVCVEIDRLELPWFVLQRGLLRPSDAGMSAFRPDIAVIDRTELSKERLWANQSILTQGSSIKFIAEVVSGNWQNDYARKLEDYATVGIPEYWIVDYAGLGGIRYIGNPKQPTLSICTLIDKEYDIQLLRGDRPITSLTFPNLNLTAEKVLKTGQ